MAGDVIDINPWLEDRRPRRQVAQDLAAREGISIAQAMLLLCVAGHGTERPGAARRRAPRRLAASRAEPVRRTEPGPARRATDLLERLGGVGREGRLETASEIARVEWEPAPGVVLTATFEPGSRGVVRAHHPTAGDTHWDLDERGVEYLRTALQRLSAG